MFTFTVSTDQADIRRTAGMLRAMADSLDNQTVEAYVGEFVQMPREGPPAAAFPPPAPPIPDYATAEAVIAADPKSFELPPLMQADQIPGPVGVFVAPIPPTLPAPINPSGKELDKNGLPFDARIHTAGENRMNKDGTWKYMRGLLTKMTQGDVDRIEAENRKAVAAPAAPVQVSAAPVQVSAAPVQAPAAPVQVSAAPVQVSAAPVQAPAAPVQVSVAPIVAASAPLPVQISVPSAPPTPAGASSVTTWVQLNQACVTRGLGKDMVAIGLGRLGPIFEARGLTNFMSLYQRPDLIPAVMADILNAFPVVQ